MPSKHNLLAVILGGGAGKRLFPLTEQRSKPAVPLGGKYRLVDVPISNCINSDVIRMFVLTQFNSASLNRHIATTYRFSPFADGFVEILAAEQTPERPDWFQGTADAVRKVLPHIRDWRIEALLILSGDHLYRMDYRQFLARHYETNADITVSVIPIAPDFASEFGLLKTDPEGRIIEFREKPTGEALEAMRVDTTSLGLTPDEARARPFLASMGIYVFKYDRLEEVLAEDTSPLDFGKEVIPASVHKYNVQAYLFNGYWEDMQRDTQANRPRVGIGDGSIIRRAIIDKNVRIGTNVRLLNEAGVENADGPDGSYYIRDRIIIVPKNGLIPDGTVV